MSLRNINCIWEKIAAPVAEKRCTSHVGRHSLSTLLVEEKIAGVRDIQRLLGHKNLATIERYLDDQCTLQTVDLL
jgi:integrase